MKTGLNHDSNTMFRSKIYSGVLGIIVVFLTMVLPLTISYSESEEKKSPVKIGGAMRLNYVYGTYGSEENPHPRGTDIGDVDIEIFRLNADIDYKNIIGRAEYRWYDGYSMIHTGYLGYRSDSIGTLKLGVVRVPFGPTAYGISTSWFFDQHFYVGLSDDPDLGIRWDKNFNNLGLSLGYYLMPEPQTFGSSLNSSRYGYDVVNWKASADIDGNLDWPGDENGYDERHQFNVRGIYSVGESLDVGISGQYGLLYPTGMKDNDNGYHYALSAHMKNMFFDFSLYSQISYYSHSISDETPWGTGDLIPMGAYDFIWPVASDGIIPGLSLRYEGIDTSKISWINSVMPYIEWSTIMKTVEDYNNSSLITVGASWTILDSLYVYSDLAISDGNFFIGNTGDKYANIYSGINHVGANGNNIWHWRLNFNFGYYF